MKAIRNAIFAFLGILIVLAIMLNVDARQRNSQKDAADIESRATAGEQKSSSSDDTVLSTQE